MEYTVRVFRVLFAIANEMGVNHGIHEAHKRSEQPPVRCRVDWQWEQLSFKLVVS